MGGSVTEKGCVTLGLVADGRLHATDWGDYIKIKEVKMGFFVHTAGIGAV